MSENTEHVAGKDGQDKDKGKGQNVSVDVKNEQHIPKSRFDQVVAQRNELNEALEAIASGLVEQIPEDQRELIPDLPAQKKIAWLQSAIKKGFFGGNQQENGPDAKRPSGKKPTDLSGMSSVQKIALGYKK